MRAVVLVDFGEWQLDDVPEPDLGDGDVLVGVQSAGLNPSDWKLADGWFTDVVDYEFPMRLGRDYTGIILEAGRGTSRFSTGDEVFGHVPVAALGRQGTLADRVALPELSCMALRPEGLSVEQAAALPLASLTAFQCVEFLAPQRSERVLVVGGDGVIGRLAVQLLAKRGAEVIATAVPEEEERLRHLGAAALIDYRSGTPSVVAELYPDGIDHLLDLAGSDEDYDALVKMLADGGRVASGPARSHAVQLPTGVSSLRARTPHDPELLARLTKNILEGDLVLPVDGTCTLEEAPATLRALREERVRGKLVVQIS